MRIDTGCSEKVSNLTAPILAFPDFSKPFFIHTDASDIGISAVLLQSFDILRPLGFDGRKLSGPESRWTVSEREMLAIVYGYEQNYHQVYGRHIEFYTDHKPLVTMDQLKMPFGRLGRLFHRLAGVDYKLNYIPGPQNFLADFLLVLSTQIRKPQRLISWLFNLQSIGLWNKPKIRR